MAVVVGPELWHCPNTFVLGGPARGGGNTICKSGGIIWIVAPASSEVSRNWYYYTNAVTTATNCTSATGWFVPTFGQLQNPGYCCRIYWDSYSSTSYWSSTELALPYPCFVCFDNGYVNRASRNEVMCIRAFRCVTY